MQHGSTKTNALLRLARLRKSCRLEGYDCIGDFHHGAFECDHVSPWTKSGCNVDADVMIVAQDWASSDMLRNAPCDGHIAKLGYDPKLPTNENLDGLLCRHFGLSRANCYLTNVFPFVKRGGASRAIPMKDLITGATRFTLPAIEIVSPRLVICLGLATFKTMRRAADHRQVKKLDEAISSPFQFDGSAIRCVAHTGALGTNNRGRDQVDKDWQALAASLKNTGER